MEWLFDQDKNVAALTTSQVIKEGYPILQVVHYSDDLPPGWVATRDAVGQEWVREQDIEI